MRALAALTIFTAAASTVRAADINVTAGQSLQAAIDAANPGDRLLVGPGTYTPAAGVASFRIWKALIVQSTNGAAATILQASPGDVGAVKIESGNVTIQGFTIQGSSWGLRISPTNLPLSNVVARDLVIDTLPDATPPGHGLAAAIMNSVIDNCVIVKAFGNGIRLEAGSINNLLVNNTIQQTFALDAIALISSDNNVVSYNMVQGSAASGIVLQGSRSNRIDANDISGHQTNGIALLQQGGVASTGNYVGRNTVTSTGFSQGRTSGSGVSLVNQANTSFVFGNSIVGHAEHGIANYNAGGTYLRGNVFSSNGQTGTVIWNNQTLAPGAPAPAFNYFQKNYGSAHPNNANVLLRGANQTEISHSFFTDSSGGVRLENGTSNTQIFRNTTRNVNQPIHVQATTVGTHLFQNRFLNSPNLFSFPGADIRWDASVYLGGNFYTHHNAQDGFNPSRTRPYSGFQGGGAAIDWFPFGTETLGRSYQVDVVQPVPGQVMAAGTRKTISWVSRACVMVDIYYLSGASGGAQPIAQNYPDSGFYYWTLPTSLPARTDYRVRIDCKNSGGGLTSTTALSALFTVGTPDLVLVNPGTFTMANGGSAMRIAWRKSASLAGTVSVYYRTPTSGLILLAPGVAANFVDATLPAISSSRVQIVIQAAANPSAQDGTDGYFSIRSGAGSWVVPSTTGTFIIGEVQELEWVSPPNSSVVDLEYFDTMMGAYRPIAMSLPDYGKFTWFIPEAWMSGGHLRATFRNSAGVAIGAPILSPTINIHYDGSGTGQWIPFYRLYRPQTQEHLITTDLNEYNFLGATGWGNQEGVQGEILNGPLNFAGVEAIPFYRFYVRPLLEHVWTTDRNEYFTRRQFPATFFPEHVIGYIFPTQVAGTVPLYRLIFNFFPYHLTTSNQFEVNALVASGNWTIEQISGYVRPAPSDQVQPLRLLSRRPRVPAYAPQSRFVNSGTADVAASATIDTSHHFGERPRLNAVVNGASFVGGGIAPGEALALFGSGFGPETPIVRAVHLRGQENAGPDLAGIKIFFDEIPAIVTVAANGEARAVAPLEIADREQVRVWIEYAGVNSNVLTLPVAVAAPGLFTADYSGQGQAVASDETMNVNSTENPAARGAVILLYFTGEGVTEKLGDADVPKPMLPVSVYIGGVAADVLEVAGVPSVPGVMQVRARIPVDVPAGPAVPVGVAVGGVASAPGVTLAIH